MPVHPGGLADTRRRTPQHVCRLQRYHPTQGRGHPSPRLPRRVCVSRRRRQHGRQPLRPPHGVQHRLHRLNKSTPRALTVTSAAAASSSSAPAERREPSQWGLRRTWNGSGYSQGTRRRPVALADEVRARTGAHVEGGGIEDAAEVTRAADILVNATPVGMSPNIGASPVARRGAPWGAPRLRPRLQPREDPTARRRREGGARTLSGGCLCSSTRGRRRYASGRGGRRPRRS